jgi:hypothetical protein
MDIIESPDHEHAADESGKAGEESKEEKRNQGNFKNKDCGGEGGGKPEAGGTGHDFEGFEPTFSAKPAKALLTAMKEKNGNENQPEKNRGQSRVGVEKGIHD